MKKIFYVFWGQFLESLTNKRIWAGYMFEIVIALRMAWAYVGYADIRVFQVSEPFIVGMCNSGNVLLLLAGYIFLISDAPFMNHRALLGIYRSGRGAWYYAMIIYEMVHLILYYTVIFLVTAVYSFRQSYIHNIWSRPLENLVKFPSTEAIRKWGLTAGINENLLRDYAPWMALVHTLFLTMMYGLILALILFILNTLTHRAVGTAIAAIVHLIGYASIIDGIGTVTLKASFFFNSLFVFQIENYPNPINAYLYLVLVALIILFIGKPLLAHVDFKYLTGGESSE